MDRPKHRDRSGELRAMKPEELQELEAKRREILEEREALKRKFEENEERLRREVLSMLSVKDRLMRRLRTKTIKTVLEDDLGEFTIETRLMTSGERYRALQLNKMLRESEGDPEKYAKAINGFKELLVDLCVTPGLDEEFWMSDNVSDDVIIAVILNTLYGSIKLVGDAVASFRPK